MFRVAGSGRGSGRGSCFRAVDEILELFAGLKERNLFWRDFDFRARLGIATDAAAALARAEAAEPADLDFVALLERFDDAVEDGFDDGLGVGALELRDAFDLLDEVGLRQREWLGHRAYASLQCQNPSARRFLVRNGLKGRNAPGCPSSYH